MKEYSEKQAQQLLLQFLYKVKAATNDYYFTHCFVFEKLKNSEKWLVVDY